MPGYVYSQGQLSLNTILPPLLGALVNYNDFIEVQYCNWQSFSDLMLVVGFYDTF